MIALVAGAAFGGACCGGPPVDPVVLAPGDRWAVSGGVLGAYTPTRWSADGSLHTTSDARAAVTIGVRARLASWAQLGVAAPAGVDTVRGAGLDDPTLLLRLEPDAASMAPRPRLTLFTTAPAGRRTDDMAAWWQGGATAAVERAGSRAGGAAYASGTLSLWAPEHPSTVPGPRWEIGASYGPRGEWGSLMTGVAMRGTLPGTVNGSRAGLGSTSPILRVGWTAALGDRARLVTSVAAGPPLPAVGRNDAAEISLATTAVVSPRSTRP